MKFFIDSVDIDAIKEFNKSGMVDGVTTNPSIIAKSGRDFKEVIEEICSIVSGPVSAEVTATESSGMIEEGLFLNRIARNVAIKVPLTWEGLEACKNLSDQDIMVNVTLCFSAQQALLAGKAGATFISPFIGRLDDIGEEGMDLIRDIKTIYNNYPEIKTEILAASIRNIEHVKKAAIFGADIATLPPQVVRDLALHPLTDKGLEAFLNDWKSSGQKII
ncbi:MAG: fructose-6-phosphate aldolase [Rhodobiaceae bacterium]|jgi:transaldolase|nr:fructose-6-phosphate aldolase [Rhodobiaceae bacterium]|tara:strand:+ start:1460 stop:2116 length:657 start_codon:yes stop_codon:yes gene_type:complete